LLIIQHDKVAIRHIEAGEVIDSGFGIVDVLVDDEGRSARVLVSANADLANRAVFAEDIVHLLARYVEGKVAHVQDAVYLRRQPRVSLPETDRRHRRSLEARKK